jgi:hypothetical protein
MNFLQELKEAFQGTIQTKDRIENRAGSIVTTAATIAALVFGLGGYILGNIEPDYYLKNVMSYVLIFGIISAITAALSGLLVAYSRKKYRFAVTYGVFFNSDGTLNNELIQRFREATDDTFSSLMTREYLQSIKYNTEKNNESAKKLQLAQWSLFSSVVAILTLVVLLGFAVYDDVILFQPLTNP